MEGTKPLTAIPSASSFDIWLYQVMICLLNPFRNASKLADAQTELAFLNNADISEPSTTTDICKGSRNGIAVEVFVLSGQK